MNDKVEKDPPAKDPQAKDPQAKDTGAKDTPAPFNWVNARFACSLPNVFKELMLQVEADVKTRNGLRPNNSPYAFSMTEDGDSFTVLLEAEGVHKSVIFSLADHAILVRDQGKDLFEVTLSFNEAGECKLNVQEQERDLWQVRRMALEDLLFRPY